MSAIEDYRKVFKYYDEFRQPIGAETEVRALWRLGKPLKDVHIADIGCGTGLYTKYFLDNGVGKVSMFDASEEMLSYARTKVADYVAAGRVPHCEQLQLPNPLPQGEQYDAICMNFVMHHLGSSADDAVAETFPNATLALLNAHEALIEGGLFMMSTRLRPQIANSVWYHALIDDIDGLFSVPIMHLAYGNFGLLEKTLKGVGFACIEAIVPLHETHMKPSHYYNIDSLRDPDFLLTDSTFTLCRRRSEKMGSNFTDALYQKLRDLEDHNNSREFMEKREELRKSCGSATVIIAAKP